MFTSLKLVTPLITFSTIKSVPLLNYITQRVFTHVHLPFVHTGNR